MSAMSCFIQMKQRDSMWQKPGNKNQSFWIPMNKNKGWDRFFLPNVECTAINPDPSGSTLCENNSTSIALLWGMLIVLIHTNKIGRTPYYMANYKGKRSHKQTTIFERSSYSHCSPCECGERPWSATPLPQPIIACLGIVDQKLQLLKGVSINW